MFNKSIAYRLSIFISIAVCLVFTSFITVIFYFNQRLHRENIENRAITLSAVANAKISRIILTAEEVSVNVANQIIFYNEHKNPDKLLSMVMNEYSFINSIYVHLDSVVTDNTNFYITRNGENNISFKQSDELIYSCDKEKEILEKLANSNERGWTDPFKCDTKGNILVLFYCPVNNINEQGELIQTGQVICELSLYELNKIVNRIEIAENEYAFIINKNGDYITHPNAGWILNRNIHNLPSEVVNAGKFNLESMMSADKTGSFTANPEVFNYEKSWVYYTPINEERWILIFVVRYKELFSELYLLTFGMLIFALLAIASIILIIIYISKKLIEPLSNVTTQLNKLSDPSGTRKPGTHDEVRLVSDSLKYLKSWFENYKEEEAAEQKKSLRRKQDLLQASEIQQSLINTDFEEFSHGKDIDIFATYKPAIGISGDLFDYFSIDDENIVFTIGDVSGKGVPAALFMSIGQTVIKSNASYKRARNIVKKANRELFTSSGHQFFLTLFLGVLNIRRGELHYCNAAHTTCFILRSNGDIDELNKFHGLPLGLYPETDYSDSGIKLKNGDSVILYTDGITEQENSNKVQFGKNRFKEELKKLTPNETSAIGMVNQLEERLNNYRGESPQTDDICLFVIKYLPT